MINFKDLGCVQYLYNRAKAEYYTLENLGAPSEVLEVYGDVVIALEELKLRLLDTRDERDTGQ